MSDLMKNKCSNCGNEFSLNLTMCPNCGQMMSPDMNAFSSNQNKNANTGNVKNVPIINTNYTNNFVNISFVLGIIALIGLCIPIIGIVCGILAMVFSNIAKKNGSTDSKCRTASILGVVGIALSIIMLIISTIASISFL